MSPRNDRTGQQHGVFKVLGFAGLKDKATLWECLCTNCGAVSLRENRYFRKDRGTPVSCKSCKGKNHYLYRGFGDIPKSYLSRIKKGAELRGYNCEVSPEYLWRIFQEQEGKCYLTKLELSFQDSTASLDRVDNSFGYVEGNVAWCHKEVNRMKGTLSLSEFVHFCSLVKEPNVTELIE